MVMSFLKESSAWQVLRWDLLYSSSMEMLSSINVKVTAASKGGVKEPSAPVCTRFYQQES